MTTKIKKITHNATNLIPSRKPTPFIYGLQSLQGQLKGNHFLIWALKLFTEITFLISAGTIFQLLGPRYETLSVRDKQFVQMGFQNH